VINKGQIVNGRYEIICLIGEGGMANVYLAYDPILERKVAIKVLRGDLSNDEKFIKRFQREAISASSLSHPNIVEIYDVGCENGNYYIVMEYVDGLTLKSLIKKRHNMILPEVLDIVKQVASGLKCAHNSYIIHRDIKPQNIMVMDDGMVKITDFGIAVAINSESLTQTNSVMGSVHYLPPEQANGTGSTNKSDIYSLGIMMFEMLTGKVPFKGETAVEVAIRQLRDPLPSVSNYRDDIPQSVENIILKACAKNPENRYQDISEMLYDLDHCLDSDKRNVRKYVYQYPEKMVKDDEPVKSRENKVKEEKHIEEKLPENNIKEEKEVTLEKLDFTIDDDFEDLKKPKKKQISKVVLGILFGVCSLIVITILLLVIYFPSLNKVKDIKVPNVAEKSVEEAIIALEALGLTVEEEIININSSTIEEGLVVKTNPLAGRTVKEGTVIKIYVSTGALGFTLEDYTGKNYLEIKGALESRGINVIIEEEEVSADSDKKEDIIIKQKPEKGSSVNEGDNVTLYIPKILVVYPDFTDGSYTVESVQEFCDKYNVTLTINYDYESTEVDGKIISQTRDAGTTVAGNATFGITVAKEKEDTEW